MKILEQVNVGTMTLKNRLLFPPMATAKSDEEGIITQEILDYYQEKSKGGHLSLIIVEHSYIDKQGKASEGQMAISKEQNMEQLKKLAATIQGNGAKAVMQINHAGSATSKMVTGKTVVGPSPVMHPGLSKNLKDMPKELSLGEIKKVSQMFKEAAIRVKEAGFDGVEIHSAHGYFLNQFFSPLSNKRTDEYGGDIYGRIKLHLEVIQAVREGVGKDYPVFLRLGASDYRKGGATLKDSVVAVKEFEKAGIDLIDISGGFCGFMNPGIEGEGYFSELTEAIKKVVFIPVILTGGIVTIKGAEDLLKKEKADLIGVGRAIFQDSTWAEKAMKELSH